VVIDDPAGAEHEPGWRPVLPGTDEPSREGGDRVVGDVPDEPSRKTGPIIPCAPDLPADRFQLHDRVVAPGDRQPVDDGGITRARDLPPERDDDRRFEADNGPDCPLWDPLDRLEDAPASLPDSRE